MASGPGLGACCPESPMRASTSPVANANVVCGSLWSPDNQDALKAGGRLGCLSGCQFHGLWTPTHRDPHIIIPTYAGASRQEWHRAAGRFPETAVFPLADCLRQVIKHHEPEASLMVLESAVNKELMRPSEARHIIAGGSVRSRRTLEFFDPKAESGSETRVRLFLQQHRFKVRSQVVIPGVGRVDLLVGKSQILECDSQAHHGDHRVDRRRDLAARELGYDSDRLSFEQVHHTWEATQEFLLRLLRTGRHLLEPRPLKAFPSFDR